MFNTTRYFYKLSTAIFMFSMVFSVAMSANFNSGKSRKKASSKNSLSFNMHNKSLNFSASNGFLYKGAYNNIKNQKSGISINMQSLYFQKGNSLYVVPMKQKAVILDKFKTPQKGIF